MFFHNKLYFLVCLYYFLLFARTRAQFIYGVDLLFFVYCPAWDAGIFFFVFSGMLFRFIKNLLWQNWQNWQNFCHLCHLCHAIFCMRFLRLLRHFVKKIRSIRPICGRIFGIILGYFGPIPSNCLNYLNCLMQFFAWRY